MSHNHVKTAVAGGNIRRGRVVHMFGEGTVWESTSGANLSSGNLNTSIPPYGISGIHSHYAPGTGLDVSLYHARAGHECQVFTEGAEALAECGGTVTSGRYQTWDNDARIVDSNPGGPNLSLHYVCQAMEDGTSGQVVRVRVIES